LGHLWCSCPSNLRSYLGAICDLRSNLGDMDLSFCLWCWCYCFFNNFTTCWRLILLVIAGSSCLLCLFYKVSFSSSSSN
jgi:hypothetical protein